MLPKEKSEYFKGVLMSEKTRLEEELAKVGRKNPQVAGDWQVEIPDLNAGVSDENDLSDIYEEFENRSALEDNLEESLTLVNQALDRLKSGAYGVCEKCGDDMGEKRLEAYPAATTCIKHSKNSLS